MTAPGPLLLVIDVGNTHTVLGVYAGNRLLGHWKVTSDPGRTAVEIGVLFRSLFELARVRSSEIRGIAIASVVPQLTPVLEEVGVEYFGCKPLSVGPGVRTGIDIQCEDPREVGAGRIINAIAGFERYRRDLIIIDFGTATTFDYVNGSGAFVGGIIAPGLTISMEALFQRTSKLPKVALARPPRVLGRNTLHAMQSGILFGYASLVDGLVERLATEVAGDPLVVATGSWAALIAGESKRIQKVEELLNLEGLRLLYERNMSTPPDAGGANGISKRRKERA